MCVRVRVFVCTYTWQTRSAPARGGVPCSIRRACSCATRAYNHCYRAVCVCVLIVSACCIAACVNALPRVVYAWVE